MNKLTDIPLIDRNTTTLVDVVEDRLVQYIISNNLRAGNPLPGENDLSQMMGVGRNVIREALSRLKSRGLLTNRKHRGIEVQEPDISSYFENAIIPQLLRQNQLIDLLELRYMLEIGIVPSLFNHITDKDITDLEQLIKHQSVSNGKINTESEQAFHSRIYAISCNKVLIGLERMLIPIFRYINENFEDYDKFNVKLKALNLQTTHEDLLSCIKDRNSDAYTDVISRHLMPYKLYIEEYRAHEQSSQNDE